ncbi:MAG TPA: hypothetical protein VKR42_02825 [Ktedonobacteraceae bacterium]|nr:hypothetical protein [Ktedonobacteraceae bacterium]
MSEADFNKTQQRLKRAKKELQWLLNMLSNPAPFLQKYDLDPSEQERLLNEDLAGILEILLPYADALAGQTESWQTYPFASGSQSTAGKSTSVEPVRPQPGRYRFIEVRRADGMVHMEMAGPGGPINWPQDPPWPDPEPEPDPEPDTTSK